jgi:hypothetical protein
MEKLKAPSRIQRLLKPSKSREILELLAIEQEKAIQREEEYLIALIQESKEFHPQWDMWLIKNMYKEHQRLVEAESAFMKKLKELLPELIQQYPRFAPFLMTLWVALGVFNDDEWAEGMEEWLTQVLNNVTILKQIWLDTEGIWWVRKHLEWWVEKILDAIQALENTLEKINAMKHPDEVTKQFLENLKKHKTPGSMWIDNLVLSEKAQALIQEYKQIYDQQQNNKELLIEDCEEWWKQIVQIVIEQSGNEEVGVIQSLKNEWDKLSWVNIKILTDEALEELNDEVQMFEQKIEMKWKQKFVFIKKQIDTMNRVTQAEKWVILRWKEKHKDLMERWNERNIIRQRQIDKLNVLFAQVNEGKMIIDQEKKDRAFEKLRLKWENIIQEILVAYENMQSIQLHKKNQEITVLENTLSAIEDKTSISYTTINQWLQDLLNAISNVKQTDDFKKQCVKKLLSEIYPHDKDQRHILIKNGLLNVLLEEFFQEKSTSFAKQEQEGKFVEEFEIENKLEKQRKTEALQFLVANNMDTPENRALINAVKFTPEAIEIGWVRWSYNNLKATDVGMNYSTDTNAQPKNYEEAHVFKWEWKFAQEDYFTRAAIDQLQQQWKAKIPTDTDMKNTLKALPWWTQRWSWEKWSAKILSILLWTQMSGYRRAGERNHTTENGYLWSASPFDTNNAWAFKRDSSEGKLVNYNKRSAFPCRPLA